MSLFGWSCGLCIALGLSIPLHVNLLDGILLAWGFCGFGLLLGRAARPVTPTP